MPCSKSVGMGERVARRASGGGRRQRGGEEEEQNRQSLRRERARRHVNGGGWWLEEQCNGYKSLKSLEILHAIYRDKINLSLGLVWFSPLKFSE